MMLENDFPTFNYFALFLMEHEWFIMIFVLKIFSFQEKITSTYHLFARLICRNQMNHCLKKEIVSILIYRLKIRTKKNNIFIRYSEFS
jgi:hypothetical protein